MALSATSVAGIAAGQNASYARRSDGTVWGWGANSQGQVGDGTTTQRTSPVQTSGLSNIALIGAGEAHAIAATTSGVVSTWGDNSYGQLGDGTTASRSTPGAISDASYAWKVGTPVFSVAAGTYTTEKTVVVTCETTGADIHYTLDGATPTEFDAVVASGGSSPRSRTCSASRRRSATARTIS